MTGASRTSLVEADRTANTADVTARRPIRCAADPPEMPLSFLCLHCGENAYLTQRELGIDHCYLAPG
jgi:hypothetical protein